MKPKNFPARKLLRQIDARKRLEGTAAVPYTDKEESALRQAEDIKTKIFRGGT